MFVYLKYISQTFRKYHYMRGKATIQNIARQPLDDLKNYYAKH